MRIAYEMGEGGGVDQGGPVGGWKKGREGKPDLWENQPPHRVPFCYFYVRHKNLGENAASASQPWKVAVAPKHGSVEKFLDSPRLGF